MTYKVSVTRSDKAPYYKLMIHTHKKKVFAFFIYFRIFFLFLEQNRVEGTVSLGRRKRSLNKNSREAASKQITKLTSPFFFFIYFWDSLYIFHYRIYTYSATVLLFVPQPYTFKRREHESLDEQLQDSKVKEGTRKL